MTATASAAPAPVKEAPYFTETVLWVKHWTDRLFSFAITRPASFRFRLNRRAFDLVVVSSTSAEWFSCFGCLLQTGHLGLITPSLPQPWHFKTEPSRLSSCPLEFLGRKFVSFFSGCVRLYTLFL